MYEWRPLKNIYDNRSTALINKKWKGPFFDWRRSKIQPKIKTKQNLKWGITKLSWVKVESERTTRTGVYGTRKLGTFITLQDYFMVILTNVRSKNLLWWQSSKHQITEYSLHIPEFYTGHLDRSGISPNTKCLGL